MNTANETKSAQGALTQGEPRRVVSFGPHVWVKKHVDRMLLFTLLALIPTLFFSFYYYRLGALKVILIAVVTAVVLETAVQKLMRRPVKLKNGQLITTALIFAFLLPATTPWWVVLIGSAVMVIAGRMLFGGFPYYVFNPALAGWAMVRLSWGDYLKEFPAPFSLDISETPMQILGEYGVDGLMGFDVTNMALLKGAFPAALGTIAIPAIIAGGIFLIVTRTIKWKITASFLASVFIFAWILKAANPDVQPGPVFHLLTGSVMLAAFFIVTDPCSTPVTLWGQILFGILCGAITMVIRNWGAYADGTIFAVLIVNMTTPLLDRIKRKTFGRR